MGCVYRYMDTDDIVQYVGLTMGPLENRIYQHRVDFKGEDQYWVVDYIDGLSRSDADILETFLIATLKPKWNKAKVWGDVNLNISFENLEWKHYCPPVKTIDVRSNSSSDLCRCDRCGEIVPDNSTALIEFSARAPRWVTITNGRLCEDCFAVVKDEEIDYSFTLISELFNYRRIHREKFGLEIAIPIDPDEYEEAKKLS